MMTRTSWMWLAVLSVAALPSATVAEPPSLVDQATDDARQRLIEIVLSLRVVTDDLRQSTAALLSEEPTANIALRRAVIDASQLGKPRQTAAAPVEIDAWIPIHPLQQILRNVVREYFGDATARKVSFEAAAGPAVVGTGRAWPDGGPHDERPGWRQCTARQIALTRAAADEDLRQRLIDRILRIPLASRLTVGHLVREYPGLRQCLRVGVAAIELGEPQFEPVGLCVQSCTLDGGQIAALLEQALSECGEGLTVDLAGPARAAMTKPLTIQGFAVAPPRDVPGGGPRPKPAARPDWIGRYLRVRAVGQAPAGVADEPTRRQLAIHAASIEAERQLWLEIEQLVLPEGDTIASRLLARPDRDEIMTAIDSAVFEMAKPAFDEQGVVTIGLAIRLDTVWQVVGSLGGDPVGP